MVEMLSELACVEEEPPQTTTEINKQLWRDKVRLLASSTAWGVPHESLSTYDTEPEPEPEPEAQVDLEMSVSRTFLSSLMSTAIAVRSSGSRNDGEPRDED